MAVITAVFMLSLTAYPQQRQIVRQGTQFVEQADSIKSQDTLSGYTYKTKKGEIYPIYISKRGKAYIIRTSKNGKQYKQYLPEVTAQIANNRQQ